MNCGFSQIFDLIDVDYSNGIDFAQFKEAAEGNYVIILHIFLIFDFCKLGKNVYHAAGKSHFK